MRKQLLSFLLVFILIIGMIPSSVMVKAAEQGSSQSKEYGSFIDGEHVINDMTLKNGMNAHPRLIMSEEKYANLKTYVGTKTKTGRLLERLRGEANNYISSIKKNGYPKYNIADKDDHLVETSKKIQRYVATLAMAYHIFGDEDYAKYGYGTMDAACEYPDWSPVHFLDTAEMCTAFAYGYDWLYDWMTKEQRDYIRKNMIEKGLNQVMDDYTGKVSSENRTFKWYQDEQAENWKIVCTGGTSMAALAIADEADATDVAAQVLTYGYKKAYDFVRGGYDINDGTYIEGLGYWDYATYYLGLMSSSLISATGTDYGLADYEGITKSAEFVRYMSSNYPYSFSYGDDRDKRDTGWPVFLWLGEYLDSPGYAAVRLNSIDRDTDFRYLDVLWIDESKQTGEESVKDTDFGAVGFLNASFRTSWDQGGLIAALHVGKNDYMYHGHFDLGTFYLESNGKRFFTDLGNEDYKLDNRKFSYRIKPEGHNTLAINPSEGTDQVDLITCTITDFQSGNEAYAITDLTEAYAENDAKKVVRGLKMIKDKECVVIQDEISLNKAGEIYWFAHTTQSIDVAPDGRSAIVTAGDDRLWVGLLSEGGKFTVMDAEPLETSLDVPGAANNDEYRKLAIHLTDTKDATISVALIPLKTGEKSPSWTPAVEAFSQWSGDVDPTPTEEPTATPIPKPSATPTATATPKPSATPTAKPSTTPTATPSATPTAKPSTTPTAKPSATPTATVKPSTTPTAKPSATPTATAKPSATPTATATPKPSATPTATATPSAIPSEKPSVAPSETPSEEPNVAPSETPSEEPSVVPSEAPVLEKQTITVVKKAKKTATYKAATLKKKKVTLKLKAKGKTKLSYKVSKYPKGAKKYISVTKKGVVTLKKGAKKGTYKVVITAKANSKYAKATKTITIKVK